jgi:small subunit ribosomal protein S35
MASVSRRLLLSTRRCSSHISAQQITPKYTAQWLRPISSTSPLRATEDTKEGSTTATSAASEPPIEVAEHVQNEVASASPTTLELRKLVEDLKALDPELLKEALRKGKTGSPPTELDLEDDEDFDVPPDEGRPGFWAEGEDSMGPDEDYYGDDLTSLGHGELEQHRELREYARLIAWELPLLSRTFIFFSVCRFSAQDVKLGFEM